MSKQKPNRRNILVRTQEQLAILKAKVEGHSLVELNKQHKTTFTDDLIAINEVLSQYAVRCFDEIVPLHIERYELLYRKLIELGAVRSAMKALRNKELLVGYQREVVSVQINETEGKNEESYVGFSIEKRKRVEQLLQKVIIGDRDHK